MGGEKVLCLDLVDLSYRHLPLSRKCGSPEMNTMKLDRVSCTESASKLDIWNHYPFLLDDYHRSVLCVLRLSSSYCTIIPNLECTNSMKLSACLLISFIYFECVFVSVYSVCPRFCDLDAFSMIPFRSAVRVVCVFYDALTQRINSTA